MSNDVVLAASGANPVAKFDNVEYNVIDGPGDESPFVVVERNAWLQKLKIAKIVGDIDRTDDLLHIASCGVAGFSHPDTQKTLSDQVVVLQIHLRSATGEIATALSLFGESARTVGETLNDAFEELYDLHEQDAVEVLRKCEGVAIEMTGTAASLERRFEGVAAEATGVLAATLSTRDITVLAKAEAVKNQRTAGERHEKMLTLSKKIAEQIPKVEARYEEAKAAQATADTRVFALGITSSIMQGIGSGISAGLALKTAPLRAGTEIASALAESRVPPVTKDKQDAKPGKADPAVPGGGATKAAAYQTAKNATAKAKADLVTAKKNESKAQEDFDTAEGNYNDAKVLFDAAKEKKAKDTDKKETAFKAAEKILGAKKKDLDEVKQTTKGVEGEITTAEGKEAIAKTESDSEAATAVGNGIGKGLDQAGDGIGKTADNYATIAGNYAKEKSSYLNMLMELQKEERDALSEISELTKKMQNQGINAELAQAAVDSLHRAVGALREIVVIVGDLKLFWAQMALNCKLLAKSDVREKIERCMKRPAQERIKAYSDPRFQVRLLQLTAKWSALRLISMEYKESVSNTHSKMGATILQNPNVEDASALAKTLSDKLVKKIEGEVAVMDAAKADITAAIKETDALKEAA